MSEGEHDAQTLLIIDDDDVFRTHVSRAFERRGYEVWKAADVGEGLELAREHAPERVLLDLRMPGGSGLDLLQALLEVDPATNVVMLTGYGSIATALEAVRRGATHYLTKPADVDEILAAFARKDLPPDAELPPPPAEDAPEATTPSLARVEWEHIQRVLTDCGGNITQAAKRLGIHRRSLQRKLQKYPVPR